MIFSKMQNSSLFSLNFLSCFGIGLVQKIFNCQFLVWLFLKYYKKLFVSLQLHTECQWDKDNSLPWFVEFFMSLEERKMTGNSGLQKIVFSGAQRNFLLLLEQHPYNGVFFFTKNTEENLWVWGTICALMWIISLLILVSV